MKKSDSEAVQSSAVGKAATLRQIVPAIKTKFTANQHYHLHFVGDIQVNQFFRLTRHK